MLTIELLSPKPGEPDPERVKALLMKALEALRAFRSESDPARWGRPQSFGYRAPLVTP